MYLNVEEIAAQCELLALQFPDVVTLETLPEATREGRPMHLLRVKAGRKAPRHGLYVQANIHAREWGTTDIVLHFVERLLTAHRDGSDLVFGAKTFSRDRVRNALERVELFIVPCVNPDGRAFSMAPGEAPGAYPNHMWRKNRRDDGAGAFGVDLNRNCEWIWDFRTAIHPDAVEGVGDGCSGWVSASDDIESDTYHGDKPFSEPEARNVRSVLDAHPHVRAFVDVHGVLGKIMTPWADDEVQTTDPGQSFGNPAYDGKRGLRDTASPHAFCAGQPPHPDGAAYREFMHAIDEARHARFAKLQQDAVLAVAGVPYGTGTSYLEMYGMSGNMNDYAWSRHLADPQRGKVDGYIYEFEVVKGSGTDVYAYGFQPPYEEPPGPSDMIHVIRNVSAGLAALLLDLDRVPIARCTPASLAFGRVRVGTSKELSIRVTNRGVRAFEVGPVSMLGPPGPFSVGVPSSLQLAPEQSATIVVAAAPTDTGRSHTWVAVEFGYPGETVRDVHVVRCTAHGCAVAEGACVAPTFPPAGGLVCLFRVIVYASIILGLALFAWIPRIRCTIKQLAFRIMHCGEGNADPCRTL